MFTSKRKAVYQALHPETANVEIISSLSNLCRCAWFRSTVEHIPCSECSGVVFDPQIAAVTVPKRCDTKNSDFGTEALLCWDQGITVNLKKIRLGKNRLNAKRWKSIAVVAMMVSGSPAWSSDNCKKWVDNSTGDMVVEISEAFYFDEDHGLSEDPQKSFESYLRQNTQLINEPIFRVLWAYVYALEGEYLSVSAHTETAERLALRKQDCHLLEVIDMAQALRIASLRKYGVLDERDEVLFDGFTSILPDSKGNKLVDSADVICEALAAILRSETGRQLDVSEDCQIKSIAGLP